LDDSSPIYPHSTHVDSRPLASLGSRNSAASHRNPTDSHPAGCVAIAALRRVSSLQHRQEFIRVDGLAGNAKPANSFRVRRRGATPKERGGGRSATWRSDASARARARRQRQRSRVRGRKRKNGAHEKRVGVVVMDVRLRGHCSYEWSLKPGLPEYL
jgi:hypothetical protein